MSNILSQLRKFRRDDTCKKGISIIKKRIDNEFLRTETHPIKYIVLKTADSYKVPGGEEVAFCTESAYGLDPAKTDEYRRAYIKIIQIGTELELAENPKFLLRLLQEYDDAYNLFLNRQKALYDLISSNVGKKPWYID